MWAGRLSRIRSTGFLRRNIIALSSAINSSAFIPPLYVAHQKPPLAFTAEAAETDCRVPGTKIIGVCPFTPQVFLARRRHESLTHPRRKSLHFAFLPVSQWLDRLHFSTLPSSDK